MSLEDNINNVRQRIKSTCQKIGSNSKSVILVAISKTTPVEIIKVAIKNGIEHIGENRVQEAENKLDQPGKIATWHLVGHLQTNKVKKALQIFDVIDSVDSYHLAQEISNHAVQLGRHVDCLLEVNTSGESSRYGASPEETLDLVKKNSAFTGHSNQGFNDCWCFFTRPGRGSTLF